MRFVYLARSAQIAVLFTCIYLLVQQRHLCFQVSRAAHSDVHEVLSQQTTPCEVSVAKLDEGGTDNATEENETLLTRKKRQLYELRDNDEFRNPREAKLKKATRSLAEGGDHGRETREELKQVVQQHREKTFKVVEIDAETGKEVKVEYEAAKGPNDTLVLTLSKTSSLPRDLNETERMKKEGVSLPVKKEEHQVADSNLKLDESPEKKDLSKEGHKDVIKMEGKDLSKEAVTESVGRVKKRAERVDGKSQGQQKGRAHMDEAVDRKLEEDGTEGLSLPVKKENQLVKEHKAADRNLKLEELLQSKLSGSGYKLTDGVEEKDLTEREGHETHAQKLPVKMDETADLLVKEERNTTVEITSTRGTWIGLMKERGSRWTKTCVALNWEVMFLHPSPLPMDEIWLAVFLFVVLTILLEAECTYALLAKTDQRKMVIWILGFFRVILSMSAAISLSYYRFNWDNHWMGEESKSDYPCDWCIVEAAAFLLVVCFILEMVFHRVMRGDVYVCGPTDVYEMADREFDRRRSYVMAEYDRSIDGSHEI